MKAGLFIVLMALQGSVWAQSAIQLDPKTATDPLDFVPKGYVVAQTIEGDLNKDGQVDTVLLIKGT
ncbi:MAG: hypothetical protein ACRDDA_07530, partial [Aeromonas sp.]